MCIMKTMQIFLAPEFFNSIFHVFLEISLYTSLKIRTNDGSMCLFLLIYGQKVYFKSLILISRTERNSHRYQKLLGTKKIAPIIPLPMSSPIKRLAFIS